MQNRKPKISVIDDEEELLDVHRELFADDFDLSCYSKPQDFLDALDGADFEDPHLVISDLKMPGMDGIEMIRRAMAKEHAFPSILLSGYLDKEKTIEAVDLGVYRLLEKPFENEQLMAAVDQVLIEHEVYTIRKEIHSLTSQLRELYTHLRMIMVPHIPSEILNSIVVDAPKGADEKKMSFENLLETMEHRLDQLLKSERVLNEMRLRKYRS